MRRWFNAAVAVVAGVVAVGALVFAGFWLGRDPVACVLVVAGLTLTVCAGYLAFTVVQDVRGGR